MSRFAPGVRATLALLAFLPFAGLGWFSLCALQTAADRVDTAAEIEVRAPQVTDELALVRWDRPGVGLVLPDSLVPVARVRSA